jgi:hypothetical protein
MMDNMLNITKGLSIKVDRELWHEEHEKELLMAILGRNLLANEDLQIDRPGNRLLLVAYDGCKVDSLKPIQLGPRSLTETIQDARKQFETEMIFGSYEQRAYLRRAGVLWTPLSRQKYGIF